MRGFGNGRRSEFVFSANELLGFFVSFVVGELKGRRFHEVTRRPDQRTANLPVERQFRAAYRIDYDAGRVW